MPTSPLLRRTLALAVVGTLACATAAPAPDTPIADRAKSTVQGAIIGTVVGGMIGGLPGAAAGSAAFGLFGLVTGKSFYDGPNRHKGGQTDAVLEREVEKELDSGEAEVTPPADTPSCAACPSPRPSGR